MSWASAFSSASTRRVRSVTAESAGEPTGVAGTTCGLISGSKYCWAPPGKTLRCTAFISFSSLSTRFSTGSDCWAIAGTAAEMSRMAKNAFFMIGNSP
ncbi:hypothetical protein ACFSTI_29905 [Rhizorhabdus histidinilytica]